MNATIINIGDELLVGQVVNTNATYIARALTTLGITVSEVCTIADNADAIRHTVATAIERTDLVLVTGGLGPTKDDITKNTLCEMFGSELYENAEALANIERIFAKHGFPLTPINRLQAWVPRCCEMINNDLGTAPCMWFAVDEGRKAIVSLPGVPFEMQYLIDEKLMPLLRERFHLGNIVMHNIITHGIGESFLADRLEPVESDMPAGVQLAYLPEAGMVKLRITAHGDDDARLQPMVDDVSSKIHRLAGEYILGDGFESISEVVAHTLTTLRHTLSTAESCTGGSIVSRLAAIAGASTYLKGGAVTYCNEAKREVLDVKESTLAAYTAVSEKTACEMALGARRRYNTTYALATTGIAGPGGATDSDPVGTVYIALASPDGVEVVHKVFNGRRQQVIDRAVNEALAILLRHIGKKSEKENNKKNELGKNI